MGGSVVELKRRRPGLEVARWDDGVADTPNRKGQAGMSSYGTGGDIRHPNASSNQRELSIRTRDRSGEFDNGLCSILEIAMIIQADYLIGSGLDQRWLR